MAQTTKGKTFISAAVDISTDDSTWTEMDGHGASVSVDGGSRATAEQHTYDGDTPIVKGGKREAIEVEVRFVYTEETGEPFEIARAIYETEEGPCYVRYSPCGDDSDSFRFATGLAVMTDFVYPQGEAAADEVVLGGFTVKAASLTKSAIT